MRRIPIWVFGVGYFILYVLSIALFVWMVNWRPDIQLAGIEWNQAHVLNKLGPQFPGDWPQRIENSSAWIAHMFFFGEVHMVLMVLFICIALLMTRWPLYTGFLLLLAVAIIAILMRSAKLLPI